MWGVMVRTRHPGHASGGLSGLVGGLWPDMWGAPQRGSPENEPRAVYLPPAPGKGRTGTDGPPSEASVKPGPRGPQAQSEGRRGETVSLSRRQ